MKKIDYKEVQIELKRINNNLKDYCNELFHEELFHSYVELQTNTWLNDIVEAKVNWCAIGEVEVEKAEAMAKLLMKAADEAKNFKYNGYAIEY